MMPSILCVFWRDIAILPVGGDHRRPSARASKALIIIRLTYVIAICQFPHIIAGSVEAVFGVFTGHSTIADYVFRFLVPTLIGNAAGGTILTALLNHAPLPRSYTNRR